ncbi:hypothetical protein PPL_09341 [Heterostelium album PN500]|uniref:Uncharacterized protein n=1 Tax=Heterostelium pallidum (strain ATCC 26659 / Pp 5 / PN500) TaxID=670386 RepID=D3BLA9_HETP5|nr:hypothetical protein PPL_09341 [Heterostelium album PN500]EFA77843.1 hypothetical protein PPL_09341 [Heterostelium album PN500]|eukprot:XP_020429971.1 hypothetical protein PPL_09341 [Heterostelium album PN500]
MTERAFHKFISKQVSKEVKIDLAKTEEIEGNCSSTSGPSVSEEPPKHVRSSLIKKVRRNNVKKIKSNHIGVPVDSKSSTISTPCSSSLPNSDNEEFIYTIGHPNLLKDQSSKQKLTNKDHVEFNFVARKLAKQKHQRQHTSKQDKKTYYHGSIGVSDSFHAYRPLPSPSQSEVVTVQGVSEAYEHVLSKSKCFYDTDLVKKDPISQSNVTPQYYHKERYNTITEKWESICHPKIESLLRDGKFNIDINIEFETRNMNINKIIATIINNFVTYFRGRNRVLEPFNPNPGESQFNVYLKDGSSSLEFNILYVLNTYELNSLDTFTLFKRKRIIILFVTTHLRVFNTL